MYASMMPRAFLVKTAPERARHDLMTSHYDLMMTSLDLHQHHHHQQQQERNTSSAFSLMTSFDRAAVDDPMTTYGKLYFICVKHYSLSCKIFTACLESFLCHIFLDATL